MLWTKPQPRATMSRMWFRPIPLLFLIATGLVAFYSYVVLGAPSDEARISIYSPAANYSLPVLQRNGREYVGLLEILEPLGQVNAKIEKQTWKLRFDRVDAQLGIGTVRVRVHGHDFDLSAPVLMENGRGLIPAESLTVLLPQFLSAPVTYHNSARRLFISQNGISYTTQVSNGNSPKLVFSFSSPVNPMIATEPGRLKMTFTRDPLVASGPAAVNVDNKAITSIGFEESNGAAAITISGPTPLMASFGNDGRTITVAPAPTAAQAQPTTPPSGPATVTAQTQPLPPASLPTPPGPAAIPPPTRTFAVIDASHGGAETGATLSDKLLEKDVTLAFALRIRQEMVNKGLSVTLIRDGDVAITIDQRAATANSMHSAIYISVHAAADGKGARVYTAALSGAEQNPGPFLLWSQAQAPSLAISQIAATSLVAEMRRTFPARVLSSSLRPLLNVTVPAVALELSPINGNVQDLTSQDYQQQVAVAAANALAGIKDKLGTSQ